MSQRRIKHDRDDAQVYVYPVSPNKTDLFTKYRYIERPRTAAVSYLDHILAKTSLTTQKATHANIESVGHQIYEAKVLKFQQEKADAVANAVLETKTKTQQEADKVLAEALDKARIEEQAAVDKQKRYYIALMKQIEVGRDNIEKERMFQLQTKMTMEKEAALEEQWKKAEMLKSEAVKAALVVQHRQLRSKAAIERETSIARALVVARRRFGARAEEQVEEERRRCWEEHEIRSQHQKIIHEKEIERLNERIAVLTQEARKMQTKKDLAQRDFVDIENDYSHFLDFTSQVDSDYLVVPRKTRHGLANSRADRQSQTNLISLEQKSQSVQTDIQILARR